MAFVVKAAACKILESSYLEASSNWQIFAKHPLVREVPMRQSSRCARHRHFYRV